MNYEQNIKCREEFLKFIAYLNSYCLQCLNRCKKKKKPQIQENILWLWKIITFQKIAELSNTFEMPMLRNQLFHSRKMIHNACIFMQRCKKESYKSQNEFFHRFMQRFKSNIKIKIKSKESLFYFSKFYLSKKSYVKNCFIFHSKHQRSLTVFFFFILF